MTNRQHRGKDEHTAVDCDLLGARDPGGAEHGQRARCPARSRRQISAQVPRARRFGQKLPNQPPAARSHRGADGELRSPRCALREQQVGKIGARDQQDEADCGGQQQQRGRASATIASCSGATATPLIGVVLGMLLSRGGARWPRARRAGLLRRRSRLQSANRTDEVTAAIRIRRLELLRHEDVGLAIGIARMAEARRRARRR